MTSTGTVIEFWQTRGQMDPLSLMIPDVGEGVREVLAEALFNAQPQWKNPESATRVIVDWMDEVYAHGVLGSSLAVGSRRDKAEECIVVDFISGMVSDIADGRSRSISRWVKGFDL